MNAAIANMQKKDYRYALLVLIGLWCALNNAVKFVGVPIDSSEGYGIEWFVVLYFTGAYIKKYYHQSKINNKSLLLYVLCSIAIFASHFVLRRFGDFAAFNMIATYNTVFVFTASVSLFCFFDSIYIKKSRWTSIIAFFSSLSFAVYIIHHSPSFRTIIWEYIHPGLLSLNGGTFLLFAITFVISVFAVCCFIEYIRKLIFKQLRIDVFLQGISEAVDALIDKLGN